MTWIRQSSTRPGRRPAVGILAALAMFASLLFALPAAANHPEVSLPDSDFEIDVDANLVADDPSPNIDWASVAETRKADLPSGSNDDAFGQGSKEDTEVPTVVDGSIPPNKSDLMAFGTYVESGSAGRFLHLFWSRVQDPRGTTNMDFEFNQSSQLSANGITPVRTAGDLLVIYELSKGGTEPVLLLSRWRESPADGACDSSNNHPCWGTRMNLTASGAATGSINTSAIADALSDGLGPLDPRTFGEASIDVDAVLDPNTCASFGSAYLKSRSSDSFTAALKDFIAPAPVNLSNCGQVVIRKATDPAGATDSFGFSSAITTDPATGGTFSLADGQSETINNVVPGADYTVIEDSLPAGWELVGIDCSASVGVAPSIDGATVTFDIDSATDVVDCTYTNRIRGSILVEKVVQGTTDRLDGAGFSFDSDDDGVADAAMTEVGTGLFCVDDLAPGDYLVAETTVPDGYSGSDPQIVAAIGGSGTCADRVAGGDDPDATFTNEAQPTLVTSADETVTVGADISDTASLSGGFNPTGTITFELYDNATCSGAPIFTDTVTVDGNGDYGPVTFTTSAVGTFHWLAAYSGDGSNAGASHACGADGEVDTVEPATPDLTTAPNLLPNDSATLSGGFGDLSGTLSFSLHDTADCSGTALFSEDVTVAGAGTYATSNDSVFITSAGTYSWLVTYTGDGNNDGATSSCGTERYVITEITSDQ